MLISDVLLKSCSKSLWKKFRERLVPEFAFTKEAGLQPATLLGKRIWCRCFPVTFLSCVLVEHLQNISWGVQVFCSRNEEPPHFKPPPWIEHLNTSGITSHGRDSFHVKLITPDHPIPKISTRLTVFWLGTWKTEFVKTIHRQERTSSEKKSDGLHKKCSIDLWTILRVAAVLSYGSAVHGRNIVVTEKV